MNAGPLRERLVPIKPTEVRNEETGEITRGWEEQPQIRGQLTTYRGRERATQGEVVVNVDACYYVRYQQKIRDGWRLRDLSDGQLYTVVVEPNREKLFKLLRCTKVND